MKHSTPKFAAAAAILATIAAMTFVQACSGEGWSKVEKELILGQGEVMRIFTVESAEDSILLREHSRNISVKELNDNVFKELSRKMVATLTATDGGVGIAGPQVGVSRRIVVVQRFDKEGFPLEVYPNIRIIDKRGEPEPGPEGCLSVPGRRGDVPRHQEIEISYTAMPEARDTTETITGFTAVIFQHECDHLDGVLYTDYID